MKRNYNTRCWMCGSTDLEPDARGIICLSCGATYNTIAHISPSPVTIENNPLGKNYSPYKETHHRPAGSLTRRAAKARINTSSDK